ncbi:MAG: hypothetical protein B6242_00630 [Anaerolineaceae bacterium 4572_78]|nr:MAG: hypothetical protein B6242_00630 [Anaerolineaceae bacterium 4572_78]
MRKINIKTNFHQEFVDITSKIAELVDESDVRNGLCHLFCPHTTGGIIFNENCDPDVCYDIGIVFDVLAPQRPDFRHSEGNSPGHIKTSLVGSDHTLFIENGKLVLGRWQGVFFAEFDGPRSRQLFVKIVGDAANYAVKSRK